MLGACVSRPTTPATFTLSILGTNDVHGELAATRGGLANFSGYVDALREVREKNGGVVLLDAGDMWQGTLESNINEGAAVVSIYNALGYDAATIGNHEFDFGPLGEAFIPESDSDDPQGALKQRISEAAFPVVAANLIDQSTGAPIAWDNVTPTTIISRAGIRIGVIGVTTAQTLLTTIRANTAGLEIAPLAATIEKYARILRDQGVDLVVVSAHAGGGCSHFGNPRDLSNCDLADEIFAVARALPRGLVDQIIGGHDDGAIAHEVNGIAITSAYKFGIAFDRVDYTFDATTGALLERRIFPPHPVCGFTDDQDRCVAADMPNARPARYEGQDLQPNGDVRWLVQRAIATAATMRAESLGVRLTTPITRENEPDAAIGRLMTDAILETSGADVAIHNVAGGIRADLPAGDLTFGDVFRVFPFDNRLALIAMSGKQLRTMLAHQVHNVARRAGVSGLRITVVCDQQQMALALEAPDGRLIRDEDLLTVASNDFLLLGGDGIFGPVTPAGGFDIDTSQPRVRDLLVSWFKARGGEMAATDYLGPEQARWVFPDDYVNRCPRP